MWHPNQGGSRNTPSLFMLEIAEISAGQMKDFPCMQTLSLHVPFNSYMQTPSGPEKAAA